MIGNGTAEEAGLGYLRWLPDLIHLVTQFVTDS
jgi:hypothetical protein